MDPRSLQKELEKEAGYDPKDPKSNKNRQLRPVVEKRIANGEPVPWQEVYIRASRSKKYTPAQIARIRKKNPNFNTRVITPRVLGGETMDVKYPDPRTPLVEWLKADENPYFARAFVNRVWASYFGRGLVEPADDLNLANPPTNAGVLAHLAKGFVKSGYDMKWVHREILNSDAYQRSWKVNDTNQHDDKNFSRYVIRRLPAEVAADAIRQATGSEERIKELASNMELRMIGATSTGSYRGNNNYMLGIFGKPARENNCDCERTVDPTLLQTLFTRNDPEMLSQLKAKGGWIDELARRYKIKNGTGDQDRKRMAQYRSRLNATRKQVAKQKAGLPKKPGNPTDVAATKKYQSQLAAHKQQSQMLLRRMAYYQKKITELAPKKPGPAQRVELPEGVEQLISETFLRTVSRYPSNKEMELARADLEKSDNVVEGIQELLLALLNTKEFMVNH
jgi:hypothetical protein